MILASSSTTRPLDHASATWVVFVLSIGVFGGFLYWVTEGGKVDMECIGTYQVAASRAVSDTQIVTTPTLGNWNYLVTVGPACPDLAVREDGFTTANTTKVCVGDSMQAYKATVRGAAAFDQCSIQAISTIPQSQAASLVSKKANASR